MDGLSACRSQSRIRLLTLACEVPHWVHLTHRVRGVPMPTHSSVTGWLLGRVSCAASLPGWFWVDNRSGSSKVDLGEADTITEFQLLLHPATDGLRFGVQGIFPTEGILDTHRPELSFQTQ
jgi:hypothetical protein